MEGDASPASGLLECGPWEDENWLYRPSVGETAGAPYKEWSGWYLFDKDYLLWKEDCQFGWGVCVERGWTTPVGKVTV